MHTDFFELYLWHVRETKSPNPRRRWLVYNVFLPTRKKDYFETEDEAVEEASRRMV